jgi:hypothetical protein
VPKGHLAVELVQLVGRQTDGVVEEVELDTKVCADLLHAGVLVCGLTNAQETENGTHNRHRLCALLCAGGEHRQVVHVRHEHDTARTCGSDHTIHHLKPP